MLPNRSAQRTSSRWASVVVARVVLEPSSRPAWSIPTTVWVRLCASIPSTPIPLYLSPRRDNGTGRWAHLSGGGATLLSSHAGRAPTSEGRQERSGEHKPELQP